MADALADVRTLHRVATHVVARARRQATGRFSLRVTPNGFGTPEFGDVPTRVRVSVTTLLVESDSSESARTVQREIAGASLAQLAGLAGVDLDTPFDVGTDTPALGDVDEPIALDSARAAAIADWFGFAAAVLDRVVANLGVDATPSMQRLWPEHFDVGLDAAAAPGVRLNLGGSPGDAFSAEPYLYVGPWTDDRPGPAGYWNAPFGAAVRSNELGGRDRIGAGVAFVLDGFDRFR
jgi:hypothetical protein